ncbi:hypothetical protein PIB30_009910 [Stylosanthes scabra]|uniref:Ubiquitin-like protease family profile domain-containing protein n=1 Tax=Stylosanthes scabra TaxID=79078 RepID=A0ABU6S5I2_9FABA|nr:hypothetical protein [Stylosanthes scabra]
MEREMKRREDVIMDLLRSRGSHIDAVTTMVTQQNKVIDVIAAALKRNGDARQRKVLVKATMIAGRRRGRGQGRGGSRIASDSHKYSPMAANPGQKKEKDILEPVEEEVGAGVAATAEQSRKRRLEFDESEEESDILRLYDMQQQGKGSPFSYSYHTNFQMVADDTPQCLDLSFMPPPGMRFVGSELAIAAYIFARDLEKSGELLVNDDHCDATRRSFWSLRPGEEMDGDVINMVVGTQTRKREDKTVWFLPTTFSQMILDLKLMSEDTMQYIVDRYMGLADDLVKAYHIENMLADPKFYDNKEKKPPKLSDFSLWEPRISQQRDRFNDCGVWVCQWMQMWHLWKHFDLPGICANSRMTLAMDLVMDKTNSLSEEICEKAVTYWDNKMLAVDTERKRKARKGKCGSNNLARGQSPTI